MQIVLISATQTYYFEGVTSYNIFHKYLHLKQVLNSKCRTIYSYECVLYAYICGAQEKRIMNFK